MRRPIMLRYNDWIQECVESISGLKGASRHDKDLISWVQLLKITEEFHTAFSYDNLCNVVNLSERRVQMMLSGYEKRLEAWKISADSLAHNGI